MAVDSVNNNKSNVLGWTLGSVGLGAAAGAGAGYLFSSPVKNGEFKDSFINSSVKTTKKDLEKTFNKVIDICENASKSSNIDDMTKYLKENLSKIDGFDLGLEFSGENLDSYIETIKLKGFEEAKTFVANLVEELKETKSALANTITADDMKKSFEYVTEIKGKKVEFKDATEEIKEVFEKCLKDFRKSKMLLWGGIGALVLGLGGLIAGINKKNNN